MSDEFSELEAKLEHKARQSYTLCPKCSSLLQWIDTTILEGVLLTYMWCSYCCKQIELDKNEYQFVDITRGESFLSRGEAGCCK